MGRIWKDNPFNGKLEKMFETTNQYRYYVLYTVMYCYILLYTVIYCYIPWGSIFWLATNIATNIVQQ